MTEVEQEMGREGVKRVRRLLEGTMRFRLPYDVYAHPERVTLPMLVDGATKHYDLCGECFDEDGAAGPQLYVESKNVADAGDQAAEFKDFLARAYSATARARNDLGHDPKFEFMWATTCPWKGRGFRLVARKEALAAAVGGTEDSVIPAEHTVDQELLVVVSQRLWVWVISERQEEMVMGAQMRGWVAGRLEETR